MHKSDAPSAGWYPDPEHRSRLRWWDGLDWTDIKRAPPSTAELDAAIDLDQFAEPKALVGAGTGASERDGGWSRRDAEELIAEVRTAARDEVNRAAADFSDRATTAVRRFQPLITEYTSQIATWIRRAIIVAIVLLTAYFIFQVVAQASLFEWIGDRIDNLTDESLGLDSLSSSPALL